MKRSKEIGTWGEELTAQYLIEQGYKVLARNYHSPYGEIDLIAQQKEVLAFVEVKTRTLDSMVSGVDAVGQQKQRKILQTALLYLQDYPQELQPRFDVCIVTYQGEEHYHLDYFTAAFDGSALGT